VLLLESTIGSAGGRLKGDTAHTDRTTFASYDFRERASLAPGSIELLQGSAAARGATRSFDG
jgi:hypothetical protein